MIPCADHDFMVVVTDDDDPLGLVCQACGLRWKVGPQLPTLFDWEAEDALGERPDRDAVMRAFEQIEENERRSEALDEQERDETSS
jgi:hypothetical protein